MKAPVLSLFLLFLSFAGIAQIDNPVKWQFETKNISATSADLYFYATIENNWHLYSQFFPAGGPIRLEYEFEKSALYNRSGSVDELTKPTEEFDDIFNIKVKYFYKSAVFRQKITFQQRADFMVKGRLEGQACYEDGKCVQVASDFTFRVVVPEKKEEIQQEKKAIKTDTLNNSNTIIQTKDTTVANKVVDKEYVKTSVESEFDLKGKSLWWIFLISFVSGLLAIFTPCVFPMIPLTVTYFMNDKQNKRSGRIKALMYGVSIVGIYTIIGTIIALVFGANFANFLSTHWLPNVLFFLIFMFFALSFLGMFEIVLPSWIVNKADKQAEKGGMFSTFFMAFTLVIVSFSCTGPIVGAILVQSAAGALMEPVVGMLGFSLAFALPFTVFAVFPEFLKSLPKSGGWLNTVKVFLGFIELALGLKFLSTADLAYHWGLLDRPIYIALWIAIFTSLFLYLLGKIKLPHDSEIKHISVPRLSLAMVVLAFVIYMLPGMWGAPLKLLAGYLPPQSTNEFSMNENLQGAVLQPTDNICERPLYSEFLHIPYQLTGYFDLKQGLECAKKLNKPVFLDFTGHGCVNCRKMEEQVWADPKALELLRGEFVIVSLYVDDKTELPEKDWVVSKIDGKIKKRIGEINADFQAERFKVNSQPYYIIMDHNQQQLIPPSFYNTNAQKFVEFLKSGIVEFKKQK